MTCAEIIKGYLTANGYAGLYYAEGDGSVCGCELNDLVCCCEDLSGCSPGYRVACTEACEQTHYDRGWHIQPEKPEGGGAKFDRGGLPRGSGGARLPAR